MADRRPGSSISPRMTPTIIRVAHGLVRSIRSALDRSRADRHGGVATAFALFTPVLVLAAGVAIDYGMFTIQQHQLQDTADQAALGAAKEYTVPGASDTNPQARLETLVNAYVASFASKIPNSAPPSVQVTLPSTSSVKVVLTQKAVGYFTTALGIGEPTLSAQATATVVGATHICVLGLNETQIGVVALTLNAHLTAQGCAVYSNSKSSNGMYSMQNALIKADLICTAGGKTGGKGNYEPDVMLDCPELPDPLAGRNPDPVGNCTYNNTVIDSMTTTLSPGVYCGGLIIKGTAAVKLNPGVYVIKNGPFWVLNTASLDGQNVAFHLMGWATSLAFAQDSSIDLTAPKTGALAGILMFEDRNSHSFGLHTITSENAHVLLGTIYLPYSTFFVDANQPVADKSAYTAIIANRVVLDAGPNLVLNANYASTDVPVPDGIQKLGQSVRLSE